MKKYSFIVFHKDYDTFLDKLGKIGVLHVIEQEDVDKEKQLEENYQAVKRVDKALKLLKAENTDEAIQQQKKSADQETTAHYLNETERIHAQESILRNRLEELQGEKERLMPWGDFELSNLEELKSSGYEIKLYKCTAGQYDEAWEEQNYLFHIDESDGKRYFMVIEKPGEESSVNAEEFKPGIKSLSQINKEIADTEAELEVTLKELEALSEEAIPLLLYHRDYLQDKISLRQVFLDTKKASDDQLMILEGWVPEASEEKLNTLMEKEDAISLASKPEVGELPPVELKNSHFARLFEPISKLFDLPGYNELDLTPFFAPFFMIFFGFCLGDAGYGVFFILMGGLLKLKAKKELKPILTLTQYFGIATIAFGLLSGTFFGINLIDSGYTITEQSLQGYEESSIPSSVVLELKEIEGDYFKSRGEFMAAAGQALGTENVDQYKLEIIKHAESGIPFIRSFRHLMQEPLNMFYLSLIIGGIQILFGLFIKVMNITRRKGFKHALPTIGWLILITGLIMNSQGFFDGPFKKYIVYGLLIWSGVFILLLNKPGTNVLNRIGSGIWDSYSMATGFFGDLLSYIRLFALGISSAILGFVFNDISLQLLDIPYIGWLLFLVLLIFGHTINLFMASLGGFIHPMRLTFVEFYKNAGFEGGGKKYKPFNITN